MYRQDLHDLIEPAVSAVGYELLGVEFVSQGHHSLLRVYIDKADGITVDDCEITSHQISALLDVEDPIKSQYRLEVSSPGLDRPLFLLTHFEKALQQTAKISMQVRINGRRNFSGVICGVEQDNILLQTNDEVLKLAYAQIAKANLIYNE